ncbi:hypothetical protein K505DRAFT_357373 [Melanomma pulvis-pyrius CBS 109.77]|uniref:WW domain-containing protein n=1 Tax=Melanomma pulvis-pyrius CBS 109.77 TaxID=1314802 RepID=A0A6A6XRK8_9PLEO|nr:hypothetical protein K505DRAFT_357373 [Melanomma pulvis-pyrius CBS 109.77]
MASNPQYELGTLVGGTWKQWSTSAGQDYYENLNTRATQFKLPAGWEDTDTDTWTVDTSKNWPQWRNTRTGRIRRANPNPTAPQTYLDKANIQAHLQLVERSPESHEYLYRRVMLPFLRHFFQENEGFDVLQEESRGDLNQNESRVDIAEIKKAGRSWTETEDHLSRYCAGIENQSGQVYGIIQIGLYLQFFTANRGVLTALSGGLHMCNDVNAITTMIENMKLEPLPFF